MELAWIDFGRILAAVVGIETVLDSLWPAVRTLLVVPDTLFEPGAVLEVAPDGLSGFVVATDIVPVAELGE